MRTCPRSAVVVLITLHLPGAAIGQVEDGAGIEVGPRVLVSADAPELSHVEPHLAVDPTDPDHLLAAVAVLPDSAPHRVDAFVSFDGGESWERKALPGLSDTESLDPWVAFGAAGRPVVTALVHDHEKAGPSGSAPAAIAVFRGGEGGRSWQGPELVSYGLGSSYDQQKVGADHSGGPYDGRLYIAGFHWGPRTRPGNLPTSAVGVISSDNGVTFAGPRELSANNVQKASVQPVVLTDGTLVLLYREWGLLPDFQRTDLLWAVHSTDGGTSYSPPFLVSAWTSPGFADAASAAAGPWTDRIYGAWIEDVDAVPARTSAADFRRDAPRSLRVAHSDHRGMNWSEPVTVASTGEDMRLTTFRIAADGAGDVAAVWTVTRMAQDGRQCHDWNVSVSTDGGDTFPHATPLSETACHPLPGGLVMYSMGHQYASVMPRFGRGGDYFGLVGLPDGGFHVLWSAAEDGVMRLWSSSIRVRR